MRRTINEAFLTPSSGVRIMTVPHIADVAELADAQVSEACDGDIVEVQVLSSAPKVWASRVTQDSPFVFLSRVRSPTVREGQLSWRRAPINRTCEIILPSLTVGLLTSKAMKPLNVVSTIEHKHEGLPRFVCIPMK